MLGIALAGLLIGYVPGAILVRLPWWNREQRARLAAEERVFWAVVLSVSLALSLVLILAWAGFYSFGLLVGILGTGSAVALLALRGRLCFSGSATPPRPSLLVPVALLGLGGALYFPPSEFVTGGTDPGTYLNEGVQIAQRGTMMTRDAVVSSLPPTLREFFFPPNLDHPEWYHSLRFMGFWVKDPDNGLVVGQFPQLFPAAIAVGYGFNGLSGARQAVAVASMLGLVAVFFAAVPLVGRAAAGMAACALAVNVVQVWFARYPSAEMLMQPLLFAALLAFTRASEGGRAFFGVVAGSLLGLMLFLRYDIVLAIAAFGAAAVVAPLGGGNLGWGFVTALLPISWGGFLYLLGPMAAYAAYPILYTRERGGVWLVAAAVLAGVLVRRSFRVPVFADLTRRWLPTAVTIVLTLLAGYAYFLREASGRLALHDAMAFRTFGWYMTRGGLAMAVVGGGLLCVRHFWRAPALFTTFVVYSLFFFYKTRVAPDHFWSARRFIGLLLPCAIVFAAGLGAEAGAWLGRRFSSRTAGRVVPTIAAVVAMAPLVVAFWIQSAPVRAHVEHAGIISRLELLASRIGDEDLLVVESRDTGSDVHTFALPLAYIYARNVLVLPSAAPDKAQWEAFVRWAPSKYRGLWFLGGGGTDLVTRDVVAEPIASESFHIPEYASPENAYPSGPLRKDFEYGLYRLRWQPAEPTLPLTLTIGEADDLYVARFHAKERNGAGLRFRWSRAQSFVVLQALPAGARELVVWMSDGGRPASALPPRVEVALADEPVGEAVATSKNAPYVFQLPAPLVARLSVQTEPVRLRLRVTTWNPLALLKVPDERDLGVMVSRVEVR